MLLQTVIDRGAETGEIGSDITITDVRIVNRMLIAAATMPGTDGSAAFERALSILFSRLKRGASTG